MDLKALIEEIFAAIIALVKKIFKDESGWVEEE